MKSLLLPIALLAASPFVGSAPQDEASIADMMARAQQYTTPGSEHELLQKFIGEWEATSQITMAPAGKAAPGRAKFSWKVEGRWVEGVFMGEMNYPGMPTNVPLQHYSWMGYDKLKQSYVWTGINGTDTAMNHAEGDLTPDGKSLIMYGTLDEYLTGEHDKMVKYAWRFVSDDEIVLEVHDLPIGEKNTKVLEFRYTRNGEER
ncbi:MAG: DUF1579 family protein [Planctomycetota bacterium]